MQSAVDWKELGIEAASDRRRETRLPLAINIEVTGFDANGRFFSERTKTLDVSESGVGFRLAYPVSRGGILALKITNQEASREAPSKPLLYQVAHSAQEPGCWIIGAAKLQHESIWFIIFAEMQNAQTRPQ